MKIEYNIPTIYCANQKTKLNLSNINIFLFVLLNMPLLNIITIQVFKRKQNRVLEDS